MTASRPDRGLRWLALGLAPTLLLAAGFAAAAPPSPYEARYSLYRNDKFTGESVVRFEVDGDRWTVTSETQGTRGLARLLRAHNTERSTGRLEGDRFQPEAYEHAFTSVGVDQEWAADFDWAAGEVRTRTEDGEFTLPLEAGTYDPLALDLALRRSLREDIAEWQGRLVDEDEIDTQRYRVEPPSRLDTALGCLDAIRVDRVRENSRRYTRVWYAPSLDYAAVLVEHGKTGENHMAMKLESITLDGTAVRPGRACDEAP